MASFISQLRSGLGPLVGTLAIDILIMIIMKQACTLPSVRHRKDATRMPSNGAMICLVIAPLGFMRRVARSHFGLDRDVTGLPFLHVRW